MEAVHKAALALGTANQLTNILRDVGEDAVERNRIYVPLEELDQFGISETEVRPCHTERADLPCCELLHVLRSLRVGGYHAHGLSAVQVLSGMFSRTTGHIDDRWQAFMKFQIARARQYFADAEAGVDNLDTDARWPVWSALILYR